MGYEAGGLGGAIYEVIDMEQCKYFRRFGVDCNLFMDILMGLNLNQ